MSRWSRFTHRNASHRRRSARCSHRGRSASPPVTPPRPPTPDVPRGPLAAGGNGTSGSSASSSSSSSDQRLDQRQCPAKLGSGRESVQVPRDVLADVAHALVLAEVGAQQLAVPADDRCDLAQCGRFHTGTAGEGVGQLGEQPRPAQAAAADDDAVAAGGGHHGQRVVGVEDVAVAEHRNARDVRLSAQRSDPSRRSRSSAAPRCGRAARRPRRPPRPRCVRRPGGCGGRRRCRSGISP